MGLKGFLGILIGMFSVTAFALSNNRSINISLIENHGYFYKFECSSQFLELKFSARPYFLSLVNKTKLGAAQEFSGKYFIYKIKVKSASKCSNSSDKKRIELMNLKDTKGGHDLLVDVDLDKSEIMVKSLDGELLYQSHCQSLAYVCEGKPRPIETWY